MQPVLIMSNDASNKIGYLTYCLSVISHRQIYDRDGKNQQLRNAHGISWAIGEVVCSYSRRRKGRIASYATISTTKKTDKLQSQLFNLFRARS
jgi:hypothetical protein